jgi:hypothetical protein
MDFTVTLIGAPPYKSPPLYVADSVESTFIPAVDANPESFAVQGPVPTTLLTVPLGFNTVEPRLEFDDCSSAHVGFAIV